MTEERTGRRASPTRTWHDDAFFGLHYDLHATADDTELGAKLSVDHLVERLGRVGPDWVQCDGKGHPGWASWPTTVGSASPGIVRDALALHREATRRLGIPLGVHYSGVWDSRAIEIHPDWARVDASGVPDRPGRVHGEPGFVSDMPCRLSPYQSELMIPQLLEVIDRYDVDGFWIDGDNWASQPCWCPRCTAEFARRTGLAGVPRAAGEPHWDAWLAFHRDLFVEYVTTNVEAVHARKPGCTVCSNWLSTLRQPEPVRAPVDYLSGDYWGTAALDRAAVEGRLLDARGLSWDLMAWAFTKTGRMDGDLPWVAKTPVQLCQELAEPVALGGAVMVYDVPQRSGWLNGWRQDLLAEAAAFCRARREICFRTVTVPQAAVVHTIDHLYAENEPLYGTGRAADAVEGALHALLEAGRSTDVLPEEAASARMGAYALVVVPERTRPSAALRAALAAYAAGGGTLLLTGPNVAADYPDLVGATAAGEPAAPDPGDPAVAPVFLPVDARAVPIYGRWQPVTPAPGTEVWTRLLDGQEPEQDATDRVAVTRRAHGAGSVVAVHGPLFENYFRTHYPPLRDVVRNLVDRLGIDWLATLEAPPRLELILRRKDDRLLVNLVNRGAGEALGPRRVVVEELPPVEQVTVRVRRPERPRAVTVVPADRPVDWEHAGGILTIRLPRVDIHSVVAIA